MITLDGITRSDAAYKFGKQRVDGLLISLSKETNSYSHLEAFQKYGIPIVFFDRVPTTKNIHKVYCNIYEGTVELVSWLFNKGYQRIALINGPKTLEASNDRLKGYITAVSKRKLKIDMQLVETTDLSKEGTVSAMKNLLGQKKPPDAIISFNDYVHMDAVQYAKQNKIKVNKDIVFASYANLPITEYTFFPPVISMEQFPYLQGERAMEIMMKILYDKTENRTNATHFYSEEFPATLIEH